MTLCRILAKHTGQWIEKIHAETERDRYMDAERAKEWGIVDEILVEDPNRDKKTEMLR